MLQAQEVAERGLQVQLTALDGGVGNLSAPGPATPGTPCSTGRAVGGLLGGKLGKAIGAAAR